MHSIASAHASGDNVCIRIGDERSGRSVEIAPERAVELIRVATKGESEAAQVSAAIHLLATLEAIFGPLAGGDDEPGGE